MLIPAHNEERAIYQVVRGAGQYAGEIIVVDDGSTDDTARVAKEAGARVVSHDKRKGYIGAIRTGFQRAHGDIIITIDADGEHRPEDIPLLLKPIYEGKADLVLGARKGMARVSENVINWLTHLKVNITDSCTGFRAIRRDLALGLNLKGQCTCGILVLEAHYRGASLAEVPIEILPTDKPRKIAWHHVRQIFYVLSWLLKRRSYK